MKTWAFPLTQSGSEPNLAGMGIPEDMGVGEQEDGWSSLLCSQSSLSFLLVPSSGPSLCPVTTTAPRCPCSISCAKVGQCPLSRNLHLGPSPVPCRMGDALLEQSLLGMRDGMNGSAAPGHPERCKTSLMANPAPFLPKNLQLKTFQT